MISFGYALHEHNEYVKPNATITRVMLRDALIQLGYYFWKVILLMIRIVEQMLSC